MVAAMDRRVVRSETTHIVSGQEPDALRAVVIRAGDGGLTGVFIQEPIMLTADRHVVYVGAAQLKDLCAFLAGLE